MSHRWWCLTCGQDGPATSYRAGLHHGRVHAWTWHQRRGRRSAYVVQAA